MPSGEPLAGVVLAGGESRRMGRDKALMPHPGTGIAMVEHTVGVLAQRCEPVFVVAAPGQQLPALNARILHDEGRGQGPLPATGRGLRAAGEAGRARAVVCAVDMPYLSADLIDRLAGHRDAEVVLPSDGRDHYLAGIYRTALADRIDALVGAGRRSMRALTDAVDCLRVEMPSGWVLTNINEPSDLR